MKCEEGKVRGERLEREGRRERWGMQKGKMEGRVREVVQEGRMAGKVKEGKWR